MLTLTLQFIDKTTHRHLSYFHVVILVYGDGTEFCFKYRAVFVTSTGSYKWLPILLYQ